jgi:hypothetical protein
VKLPVSLSEISSAIASDCYKAYETKKAARNGLPFSIYQAD